MEHEDGWFLVFQTVIWLIIIFAFRIILLLPADGTQDVDGLITGMGTDTVVSSRTGDNKQPVNVYKTGSGEVLPEIPDDFTSSADLKYSVLNDTIEGKYKSDSGVSFYFGPRGYFSGFFCDGMENIDGGTWRIVEKEDRPVLQIIDEGNTGMVSYLVRMDGEHGYILSYEPADLDFVLEEDNG